MPLLLSPIDGSPMRQVHRFGIELDVCPTSGGIWLDKGELEKLLAMMKEEAANEAPPPYVASKRGPAGHRYRDDDFDDDDDEHVLRGYKKKSKMSRVMDIFDF